MIQFQLPHPFAKVLTSLPGLLHHAVTLAGDPYPNAICTDGGKAQEAVNEVLAVTLVLGGIVFSDCPHSGIYGSFYFGGFSHWVGKCVLIPFQVAARKNY